MKQIVAIIGLLLSISPVFAIGVSYPNELELMNNEAGRISFSVQLVQMETSTCRFSIEGIEPLTWELDKGNEITFEAGSINHLYGTISVPKDAEERLYEGKIKVQCVPHVELEGSGSRITQSMNVPIKVNVVNNRTKENLFVPPKPADWFLVIIIIAVVAVIIISMVVYNVRRRNKKTKAGNYR
jgi:hypothetical protein